MPDPIPAASLSLEQARLLWSHRQALGLGGKVEQVPGGWIRSLGGVDPYLSLRARIPSSDRPAVDAALAADKVWVVPGVRNCISLVPQADVSLALRVSDAQSRKRTMREMEKLGVSAPEIKALGNAVVQVLTKAPASPEDLRKKLPKDSWRTLGDAGKKIGHTTNLPAALRLLEWDGRIRRRQQGGRLDTNRYAWELSSSNPLALGASPTDANRQAMALARRFFAWAGPATLSEFVAWAAITKTSAKKVVDALKLVPVAVESVDELSYVLPEHVGELNDPPADNKVHLIPAQDSYPTIRSSNALLAAAAHHDRQIITMGGKTAALASTSWLHQRPLIHRGEWLGLWDFDEDHQAIIFAGFAPLSKAVQKAAQQSADSLTPLLRDQLDGLGRAHSIDSEKRRRQRWDAIRAMQ